MTEGLAAGAPQVLDLLNYIEQVEKPLCLLLLIQVQFRMTCR